MTEFSSMKMCRRTVLGAGGAAAGALAMPAGLRKRVILRVVSVGRLGFCIGNFRMER